jgi:nitrogen fixation protein NifB
MTEPDGQQSEEMKMEVRVAVATSGDGLIDLHFGHADEFWVFGVNAGGVRLVERRIVEQYCKGGVGDEDKRDVIMRALQDCSALFAARIGNGPRGKLAAVGMLPVDEYALKEIEPSIEAWHAKFIAATLP